MTMNEFATDSEEEREHERTHHTFCVKGCNCPENMGDYCDMGIEAPHFTPASGVTRALIPDEPQPTQQDVGDSVE